MNGILNILKPPGMTSQDVVSYVKKVSGEKKAGHTGTLDPGAAGVLPVCLGKATKIVNYIMDDKKEYICEVTLGNETDTCDKYGNFLYDKNRAVGFIDFERFKSVVERFKGKIRQTPPAYSAVKVNGKRSYELARQGIETDLPEREIKVYSIEILSFKLPYAMLKIECSKGTYIRSICRDIGIDLGCGAYMSFLIRTRTGSFTLKNCYTLDEIKKNNIEKLIIKPDLVLQMNSVYVDKSLSSKLLNGNKVPIDSEISGRVKIYIKPDNFVAIGIISDNYLHVEKLMV